MKLLGTIALSCILISNPVWASELTVDTGMYLSPAPTVVWWGSAVYLNNQGDPGIGVALGASVGFWSLGWKVDEMSNTVYSGLWSRDSSFETVGGECFSTSVAAQTFDRYQEKQGETLCVPKKNPYPSPPPVQTVENNQCGDPCSSPIVLDMWSGQYRLSSALDGVMFDINADGRLDRVAWPMSPDTLAFLFIDRNGNGLPDDGAELFGDHSIRADGVRAENGFDALASFDANTDGRITSGDAVWPSLRLWFDRNRDGAAVSEEVVALSTTDVTTLGTAAVWNQRRDVHGNILLWKALFERSGAAHPFYDAYLTIAQ